MDARLHVRFVWLTRKGCKEYSCTLLQLLIQLALFIFIHHVWIFSVWAQTADTPPRFDLVVQHCTCTLRIRTCMCTCTVGCAWRLKSHVVWVTLDACWIRGFSCLVPSYIYVDGISFWSSLFLDVLLLVFASGWKSLLPCRLFAAVSRSSVAWSRFPLL